ncbi:hypothetical protein D3C81_1409490 [compost metagenome]
MPGVSMLCAPMRARLDAAASRNRSRPSLSTASTRPGLVQNWPAPSVSEPAKAVPMASARLASALGNSSTGLMLLISANTGIGAGRAAAIAISAVPPAREPVKPTARMRGSATRPWPTSRPASNSSEKVPSGRSSSATACWTARPTSSEVPGCAECALTTTGQPAASAEAVSPPATENASGKLLAPNTATGPSGIWRRRRSGRGSGWRSGWAGSTRSSRKSPWRSMPANRRNWPTVRPRSPSMRPRGRPDSATQRSTSASPSARMFAAIASRKSARRSGEISR